MRVNWKVRLGAPCLLLSVMAAEPLYLSAQQSAWVNASVDQTAPAPKAQPPAPSGNVTAVPEDFSKLQLAPGFLLAMAVYNAPEMSMNLRVDSSGDVTIPTAGSIHIAGQTVAEAQDTITKVLKNKDLFNNPQVSLNVLQYTAQDVNVLGEVQSPGRIEILAPRNLADVLALAGGETPSAGTDIEIKTTVNGEEHTRHIHYLRGKSTESLREIMVVPGSTVYVNKVGTIYVLGSVLRPGGYEMINGGSLNVAQALALAQGTIPQAAVGSIRIVRQNADGTISEIHVPYKKIASGKAKPAMLMNEDVVYVPSSKIKSVLLSGTGILAATAGAATFVMAP